MDALTTGPLSKSLRTLNLYFFLRVVQVGSAVIAGFECIITFLEACLTTGYFISSQTLPNYRTILISSSPATFLFAHFFSNFWDKQSYAAFHCMLFPYFSHFMSVEEKQCVTVQCVLVAAGISLFFSLAVSIMAGTIAGIEKWKEEHWAVLADWTIVKQLPQVVVSDAKTGESSSVQV
ncbi:hypothetical protein MMC30_002020 [Trapelia coarctata]|nr:hypothetical protein [Trapelia coarctata]